MSRKVNQDEQVIRLRFGVLVSEAIRRQCKGQTVDSICRLLKISSGSYYKLKQPFPKGLSLALLINCAERLHLDFELSYKSYKGHSFIELKNIQSISTVPLKLVK